MRWSHDGEIRQAAAHGSGSRQAKRENGCRATFWKVEHPVDWKADERRKFLAALGVANEMVTLTEDRDLAAGIRIRATQATLDATIHGLMADRSGIEALLLAEITLSDGKTSAAIMGAWR